MGLLLGKIDNPKDLKKLKVSELPILAHEIRGKILETVSQTGGHLAASLGAVEIAIALHYALDCPQDSIIWDVGHQAYAHKLLTGRKNAFSSLRQLGGVSGFPNKHESHYDAFTTGHGSASISTALGLAAANDLEGKKQKVVAVIGDGSLGGGMALEALNHAGSLNKDILVVLNDNEHSIAPSVGAMSRYLNRIIANPIYNRMHKELTAVIKKIPKIYNVAKKLEEGLKNLLVPGIVFEELGFRYFGPMDGHNVKALVPTFKNIINLPGPKIIHLITKKGKGYDLAEKFPERFHGTAPFDVKTGKTKEPSDSDIAYTQVFSEELVELARQNPKIIAVTAAMPEGTGLDKFGKEFPERFFNVGMAEEHAVSFSAGLARKGFVPIVAIYSTFLQRSYDQIIHDVALQNLHLVLALDRAGIVGEDGATHHGLFDIAYLRHIPNLVSMAPKDSEELKAMLKWAVDYSRPVAIRYPRGAAPLLDKEPLQIEIGKAEILKQGSDVAIFALGSMVAAAVSASQILKEEGLDAAVVNARFINPLDEKTLSDFAVKTKKIVCVEEGVLDCGFGSHVLEALERLGIDSVQTKRIGLPNEFIEHGKKQQLLDMYGLNARNIARIVKESLYGAYKDR